MYIISLENHLKYQLATQQMEPFNLKKFSILFFDNYKLAFVCNDLVLFYVLIL